MAGLGDCPSTLLEWEGCVAFEGLITPAIFQQPSCADFFGEVMRVDASPWGFDGGWAVLRSPHSQTL